MAGTPSEQVEGIITQALREIRVKVHEMKRIQGDSEKATTGKTV
jgi:hypothetical protein